ncbi:hypothetical protein ACFPFV_11675 [Salinicoccus siamensis]
MAICLRRFTDISANPNSFPRVFGKRKMHKTENAYEVNCRPCISYVCPFI